MAFRLRPFRPNLAACAICVFALDLIGADIAWKPRQKWQRHHRGNSVSGGVEVAEISLQTENCSGEISRRHRNCCQSSIFPSLMNSDPTADVVMRNSVGKCTFTIESGSSCY